MTWWGVDVAALATALAVPGERARLYQPNGSNKLSSERMSIDSAVESYRPFVIPLRDAIVAIDYDPAEVMREAFDRALNALAEQKLSFIRVSSGRPGHEHVFVVLPAWRRPDQFAAWLTEEVDIAGAAIHWSGRNTMMRPPLAPHRSGSRGQLITPATMAEAIDIARPKTTLPEPTQRILQIEQYAGPVASRSTLKAQVMTGAVNGNTCFESVRTTLWNDPGPVGKKIREQGYDDILRSWRNFQDYVAASPPKRSGYVRRQVARVEHAATLFEGWDGHTVHNDRAALRALCQTALMAGTLEPTAALRTLALRAGLETRTLSKSINRLVAFGFLTVERSNALVSERGSSRYRLRDSNDYLTTDTAPIRSMGGEDYCGRLGPDHDAFAPKALGKPGWLILISMPQGGADAAAIAKLCGYKSSTSIHKRLCRMARAGVVECDEYGVWRITSELDLDAVARRLGTLGRTERMRARYAAEREQDEARRRKWATTAA